jgi:hypothetical protein
MSLSGLRRAFVGIVAELTVGMVGPLEHVVKPALHWDSSLDPLLNIRELSHVLSDELEKAFDIPHLGRKNIPGREMVLLQ